MNIGLTHTSVLTVSDAHTAQAMGSGDMPVLATPVMIALMENAAMLAVDQELPQEQTTVGAHIDVSHLQPSALGAEIFATAELTEIDGRRLTFHVVAMQIANSPAENEEPKAKDPILLGEGTHVRYIVDRDRFLSKP